MYRVSDDSRADLYYGYVWPVGGYVEDVDFNLVVRRELIRRGLPGSAPRFPSNRHAADPAVWGAWLAESAPARDAYNASVREIRAEIGVKWILRGSRDYSGTALIAMASLHSVRWSEAMPLMSDLGFDPEWKDKLDRFMEDHEIDPPTGGDQPCWWLTAFYG